MRTNKLLVDSIPANLHLSPHLWKLGKENMKPLNAIRYRNLYYEGRMCIADLFFSIVCVLSGGNINSSRMSRVIDRGMAAEGRLVKFSVTLPDVPGAMAKLLAKVMDIGADVKSFVPERAWMRRDIFTVSV